MTLKLYNTFGKKKEEFNSIKKGEVGLYSCGPTVYNFAHIGNFRSYIFVDLLKRYLLFKGLKVNHIMNITDIDDKTIRDSGKVGWELGKFTEKYTKEFMTDISTLGILPASKYPKATEHIQDMIDFTKVLMDKGFAYEKLGSVYFSLSKFKEYGKLSKIDLTQMKAGARVDMDEYEKDHPGDFTLLKKSKLDEMKRGISYDTEWGKVRPGWHLECSVMSMKYLGTPFDIHCGGIDLTFPHHENEIAQAEAYSGKKFVNYWMHCEHLIVDGKKMSKSLGNFYTLRDVLAKGYSPMAIRYELISTHYRQKLNFTFKGIESASNAVKKLNDFIFNLQDIKDGEDNSSVSKLIDDALSSFEKSMDDDLNISEGLAVVFGFIGSVNKINISEKDAVKVLDTLKRFNSVLGVMNFEQKHDISSDVEALIKERDDARLAKDWAKADEIRDSLKEKGIELIDSKEGTKWKKL